MNIKKIKNFLTFTFEGENKNEHKENNFEKYKKL